LGDSVKQGAPGTYQSGEPSGNVIPIWKVAAPALDMVSPDNYAPEAAGLATRSLGVTVIGYALQKRRI
jgi:hypothetical protein